MSENGDIVLGVGRVERVTTHSGGRDRKPRYSVEIVLDGNGNSFELDVTREAFEQIDKCGASPPRVRLLLGDT